VPDGFAAEGLGAMCPDLEVREIGIATESWGRRTTIAARRAQDSASSRIRALGWHHATHNPHGFARAASGHAG